MTLHELLGDVAALGFSPEAEADAAFLSAVNRALCLIYGEFPVSGRLRILADRPEPLTRVALYRHSSGATDTFSLSGQAFSCRLSGRGSYTVSDADGDRTVTLGAGLHTVRGFIRPPATVTFGGEYLYTVTNLCDYTDLPDAGEDAIPLYDERQSYPLSALAEDFLCFLREPCDAAGEAIPGATLEGETLFLPGDYTGEVIVTYRRRPHAVVSDDLTAEVDIPPRCEALLPLLVASYLWLDDDGTKAQYYMALYREAAERMHRYDTESVRAVYRDVTGWG